MKYLFILMALIVSCSPTGNLETSKTIHSITLENEGPWKSNFKNMVFSNVLLKFYGKDFSTCCLSKDASGTANYDWINYDSLVYNKILNISDAFVKRHSAGSEIEGKKVMMNYALEFRNSHELDSLTGIHYQQYRKDSIQRSGVNK